MQSRACTRAHARRVGRVFWRRCPRNCHYHRPLQRPLPARAETGQCLEGGGGRCVWVCVCGSNLYSHHLICYNLIHMFHILQARINLGYGIVSDFISKQLPTMVTWLSSLLFVIHSMISYDAFVVIMILQTIHNSSLLASQIYDPPLAAHGRLCGPWGQPGTRLALCGLSNLPHLSCFW